MPEPMTSERIAELREDAKAAPESAPSNPWAQHYHDDMLEVLDEVERLQNDVSGPHTTSAYERALGQMRERAEAAESRAADLERQLAHEQTLRKSAEERVAELEALFEWREDEDAPPLSTDSDQTEYQRKWDLVEQARANHRRRVELTDALRASVEAAERKRGERRG